MLKQNVAIVLMTCFMLTIKIHGNLIHLLKFLNSLIYSNSNISFKCEHIKTKTTVILISKLTEIHRMIFFKQNFTLSIFFCHGPYFLNDKLVAFAENFVSKLTSMLFNLKNRLEFITILPFEIFT